MPCHLLKDRALRTHADGIHAPLDPAKDPWEYTEELFDLLVTVAPATSDPNGTAGQFMTQTDGLEGAGGPSLLDEQAGTW